MTLTRYLATLLRGSSFLIVKYNNYMVNTIKFRSLDKQDYQEILNVCLVSAKYDQVDSESILRSVIGSMDDLIKVISSIKEKDNNILVVENEGDIVGFSYIKWWTENDGIWLYLHLHYLLPEWRKDGVFGQMFEWAENRIRKIAINHDIKGKGMFGSNAISTEVEKTKLLFDTGYKQVFSRVEMVFTDFNNLQDKNLPADYILKPVNSEHFRAMLKVLEKAYLTREHTAIYTEEDYEEFVNNPNNDLSLWYVVWHQNEIIGYVLSEIRNGAGVITEVVIDEKHRRRGLARILTIKNLLNLQKRGVKKVYLDTNGEDVSGARSMYEKIGFKKTITDYRYRKQM